MKPEPPKKVDFFALKSAASAPPSTDQNHRSVCGSSDVLSAGCPKNDEEELSEETELVRRL